MKRFVSSIQPLYAKQVPGGILNVIPSGGAKVPLP